MINNRSIKSSLFLFENENMQVNMSSSVLQVSIFVDETLVTNNHYTRSKARYVKAYKPSLMSPYSPFLNQILWIADRNKSTFLFRFFVTLLMQKTAITGIDIPLASSRSFCLNVFYIFYCYPKYNTYIPDSENFYTLIDIKKWGLYFICFSSSF